MQFEAQHRIPVLRGKSGHRDVLVGFAPAALLSAISYVDVLDETTGQGYQRRFNRRHSANFKNYIQQPESTTIPLTFNLRPAAQAAWEVEDGPVGESFLVLKDPCSKVLSQVDCQHRLGFMDDSDISFSFMIYVGLSVIEEMAVFNIINAKSKGLSRSLTDYHDLKLIDNVEQEKPELVVAIHLNQDVESPWHMQLDIGGNRASGMKRRASYRTMQNAVKRFLREVPIEYFDSVEVLFDVLKAFWCAVAIVLEEEWKNPRKHFITKGIGVYALSSIAADLCKESINEGRDFPNQPQFITQLERFLSALDWSSSGPLKGLGGESGVSEALRLIRKNRLYAVGT